MALAELCVLDVGHGNCGVVHTEHGVVVIDAPLGSTLLDFLMSRAIGEVAAIIVSHGDADHIEGLIPLLLDKRFVVKRILVNPDATKNTDAWQDFRRAVMMAEQRYSLQVSRDLGSNTSPLILGPTRVEIVAPSNVLALGAPGGRELEERGGRRLSSNSLSAVVRVVHDGIPRALLTGDIDEIGLADLEQRSTDLHAELLVFPHHGGHVGQADNAQFTGRLCRAVGAATVVFSIGRGRHGTPSSPWRKSVKRNRDVGCGG